MGVLRSSRPERIVTEDETYIRDDILAATFGTTTRSLARADSKGAPFVIISGTKYRPEKRYSQYVAKRVVEKRQPRRRR